eukprot:g14505.t1
MFVYLHVFCESQKRTKEVEGLYDVGCLEWATWSDADRDRIKPIRTGFVDAIKVDEASGMSKDKSRLVIYGTRRHSFHRASPMTKEGAAAFKFDKGDVEVFCGMQFKRIVANEAARLRQWPLRKLADQPSSSLRWPGRISPASPSTNGKCD